MDTILVISNEPALAETLRSELPEVTVATPPLAEPQNLRLILADEGTDENLLESLPAEASLLRLARPVRLSALLYTIREKLQSKTAAAREELPLARGWRLAPAERTLRAGPLERITLTEKEAELLIHFIEQKDTTLSREELLKRVWGYSAEVESHTLETHIYRLRGKLRQADEAFDIVFSEEGGYRLSLA